MAATSGLGTEMEGEKTGQENFTLENGNISWDSEAQCAQVRAAI